MFIVIEYILVLVILKVLDIWNVDERVCLVLMVKNWLGFGILCFL